MAKKGITQFTVGFYLIHKWHQHIDSLVKNKVYDYAKGTLKKKKTFSLRTLAITFKVKKKHSQWLDCLIEAK